MLENFCRLSTAVRIKCPRRGGFLYPHKHGGWRNLSFYLFSPLLYVSVWPALLKRLVYTELYGAVKALLIHMNERQLFFQKMLYILYSLLLHSLQRWNRGLDLICSTNKWPFEAAMYRPSYLICKSTQTWWKKSKKYAEVVELGACAYDNLELESQFYHTCKKVYVYT